MAHRPAWRHPSELRPRKPRATDGGTMVARAERTVAGATQAIVADYNAVKKHIGDRPFGTEKVSQAEQLHRYAAIRDDPNAWTALLQQHGVAATCLYALRMEKLAQRVPDHAAYLNPEPQPPQQ